MAIMRQKWAVKQNLTPNFTGICAGCGIEFSVYAPPSKPRRFCSQQCGQRSMSGRKQTTDHLEKRIRRGAAHANWKGDLASEKTGRSRALHWFDEKPCEVCGERGERHHVDENTLNNIPSNIRFLCRKHHMEVHGQVGTEAMRKIRYAKCKPRTIEEKRKYHREYIKNWRAKRIGANASV